MNSDVLLITGVSSGVGLSLARYLSSRFHVIGIARKLSVAQSALDDVKGLDIYKADLRFPDQIDVVMDQIAADHGVPKYVINNAGVNRPGQLDSIDLETLDSSMQVNFYAPWSIMRKTLPAMAEENHGRIINITSGAPLNCFAGFAAYSASKAALNAMTVTAANEYSDRNIRINLMSPGPVRSNMAPDAPMDPSACHSTVDYLLDIDADGPTGRFFWLGYEIPISPRLDGIDWMKGKAPDSYHKIV